MRNIPLTLLLGLLAVFDAMPATCPVHIVDLVWNVRPPYDARVPQPYFWIAVKNLEAKGVYELTLSASLLSKTGAVRAIPFSYYIKNIRSNKTHTSIFPARLDNAGEFDNVRVQVQSIKLADGSTLDKSQLLDCERLSK
jgi:hypothetical protein